MNPEDIPKCPEHKTEMEFCDGSWFCELCWQEWDPEPEPIRYPSLLKQAKMFEVSEDKDADNGN